MALELSAGTPEWREALKHLIELTRVRYADGASYSGQLQTEMQRVVDAEQPFAEAALATDAAITLIYTLASDLRLAMADYAKTELTLDQILSWVQGKLEMHSGVAQAAEGGLDDLLGLDE